MSDANQTHHRWHVFFQEDSTLVHMRCACNTVQLLRRSRLPFSWTMALNSPELNTLIARLGSHTAAWLWVVSQKYWRNQAAGSILAMRFSCSPFCQVVQKQYVIWGGKVKRRLIPYFISNISAKKISKCVHVCQSYRKPKVGRFLRNSVMWK